MEIESAIISRRTMEAPDRVGGKLAVDGVVDWTTARYHINSPSALFLNLRLHPACILSTNGASDLMMTDAATSEKHVDGQTAMVVRNSAETMSPPEKAEEHEKQRGLGRVYDSGSRKKMKTNSEFEPALASRTVAQGKTVTSKSGKRSSIAEKTPKITKKQNQGTGKSIDGIRHNKVSVNEKLLNRYSASTGILDLYGLKTAPVQISNRAAVVFVEELLLSDFTPSQASKLTPNNTKTDVDGGIVNKVSKALEITDKSSHAEDKIAIRSLCSESAHKEFRASSQQPLYKEEASATVASEAIDNLKGLSDLNPSSPAQKPPFFDTLGFVRTLDLPATEPLESLLGMPAREKEVESRNSSPKLLSTSPVPLIEMEKAVSKASQRSDREPKHGDRWLKCLPAKSMNDLSEFRLLSLNDSIQEPPVVEEQRERLQRSNVAERREMIDLNVVSPEQLLESSIDGWKETTPTTDFILKQPCPSANKTVVESRWREENTTDYVKKGEGTAKEDGINLHGCLRNEDGLQNSDVVSTEALHINHNMSQPFARNCVDDNSVANQIPKEPRNLLTEKVSECYSQKTRVSNEIVETSFSLAEQPSQKVECPEQLPCSQDPDDHLQKNKQPMEGPSETVDSPRAKAAAINLLHMSNSSWDHHGFTSDQEGPPFVTPKNDVNCEFKQTGRLKQTKGRSKNGRSGSQVKPPLVKKKKPGNDTKSAVSHVHENLSTNTERCQGGDWIPDDDRERTRSMSDLHILSCPSLAPKKGRKRATTKPKVYTPKHTSGNPLSERRERSEMQFHRRDTHKRSVASKDPVEVQNQQSRRDTFLPKITTKRRSSSSKFVYS